MSVLDIGLLLCVFMFGFILGGWYEHGRLLPSMRYWQERAEGKRKPEPRPNRSKRQHESMLVELAEQPFRTFEE